MSTFRIAVDAHWLVCWSNSGISTYLRGLLNGWAQSPQALQVDLLVPFRPGGARDGLLDHPKFRLVFPGQRLNPIASYRAQVYWQQVVIPRLVRRQKPDVYLSPFHLTPLGMPGIKVVSTIHDLCFMAEPRFSRGRWLQTAHLWSACLRASRLICISQATHRALAGWSPTFASKATVVHNGFEGQTMPETGALQKINRLDASLKPRQYLLWVGFPCERKNLKMLFQVFQAHYQKFPNHHFVVVTAENYHGQIRSLAKAAGVGTALRTYAADNATRDALYRCALAFIFPSTCEGFGYPALEALVQGCPTISLQGTAMDEILEGVMPLVAEPTAAAFVDIISSVLKGSELDHQALGRSLIQRAGQFSSQIMAESTLEILRGQPLARVI